MIVVAIIGILAAIAIPAYQNYTIRAQVTEGLTLADGWKTAIGEFYAQNGTFPTGFTTTGSATTVAAAAATTGKYVSSVNIVTGGIQIIYSNTAPYVANKAINGLTLGLTPYLSANNDIVWICRYGRNSVDCFVTDRCHRSGDQRALTVLADLLPRLG